MWVAPVNTVLAGPPSGTADGPIGARALVATDIAGAMSSAAIVVGVAAGYKIARGTASVTGNTAINTGLATLVSVGLNIVGVLTSSASALSWSALASTGYFSAFVYANPTATNVAPAQSVQATVVSWSAQGT